MLVQLEELLNCRLKPWDEERRFVDRVSVICLQEDVISPVLR